MEIEIRNLKKKYKMKYVLDGVNLTIPCGVTYGLLGKNGAGKTTLINILSDFVKPDDGSVKYRKEKLNTELKKEIGLVSDLNCLIEEFTGYEYLNFIGCLYKLEKKVIQNRIMSLVDYFFEDSSDLNKYISKYSTGMKKKLEICAAVINTPKILLLDEPFSGLDILAVNFLLGFLKNYQNGERIILISSHNLNYIEKIVSNLAVLNEGRLVFDGTLEEFTLGNSESIDDSLFNKLKINEPNITDVKWAF